jgi:hypothetical protein
MLGYFILAIVNWQNRSHDFKKKIKITIREKLLSMKWILYNR